MNHCIKFTPTEDRLRKTVRDYYYRVLLREKLGLLVVLLILLAAFVIGGWLANEPAGIIFGLILFIFVAATWLKSYMSTLESGKASIRLLEGDAVELLISEAGLEFRSPKVNTRYSWNDFTSFIETRQSLILLNKKVPVSFLSKDDLPRDALEGVKTRVPQDLRWRKKRMKRTPSPSTLLLFLGVGAVLFFTGRGCWSMLQVQLSAAAFMDEALDEILAPWSADALLDRASEELMSERSEAEIRSDVQDWRRLGSLVSFIDEKEWTSTSVSSEEGRRVTAHRVVQGEFIQGLAEIHLIVIQKGELWEILSFEVEKIPKEQELESGSRER